MTKFEDWLRDTDAAVLKTALQGIQEQHRFVEDAQMIASRAEKIQEKMNELWAELRVFKGHVDTIIQTLPATGKINDSAAAVELLYKVEAEAGRIHTKERDLDRMLHELETSEDKEANIIKDAEKHIAKSRKFMEAIFKAVKQEEKHQAHLQGMQHKF